MGKKNIASGSGDGPNTIFKVSVASKANARPVYEMICRTVAVMRRRSDDYLNATQILKVAGFDKPQRTRVLEREVQKGEHEKVQGGYGKYQGTWVPIERGLALAKQYNVEDLLRPLIDYVPTAVSPPPAPKHAVAAPTKTKKEKVERTPRDTPSKTGPGSSAALAAQAQLAAQKAAKAAEKQAAKEITPEEETEILSGDESMRATPVVDDDSSSVTPSPVGSVIGSEDMEDGMMHVDGMTIVGDQGSSRKRSAGMMMEEEDYAGQLRRARGNSAVHTPQGSPRHGQMGLPESGLSPEEYANIITHYFVSETSQIPSLFISPPPDFNPDMPIDEWGHTALHWACAMGRIRVVKLLLSAGASIFVSNESEQTPLMRAAMFTNNYDVRKFSELYELLHRSTLNIDRQNRTVFHHIANLALVKGKAHAARYYMETILSRLGDYPQELADVINFQDEDGETALTLSARARSRRLVKALLDHGADPKVKNRDFKSAEDYILEDERFRSSPVQGASSSYANGGKDIAGIVDNEGKPLFAPQLYHSEAARLAGGQCLSDISSNMENLAKSFDSELQSKERDILQAKALLTNIHSEVTDASRLITSLMNQSQPIDDKRRELESIQNGLSKRIAEDMKVGFGVWVQGQIGREGRWSNGGGAYGDETYEDLGTLMSNPPGGNEGAQAEEERLRWEIEEKRRRRMELIKSYVKLQAEAGTGEKIAQYRKLISAGCGGSVAINEVDGVMTQLLEIDHLGIPLHNVHHAVSHLTLYPSRYPPYELLKTNYQIHRNLSTHKFHAFQIGDTFSQPVIPTLSLSEERFIVAAGGKLVVHELLKPFTKNRGGRMIGLGREINLVKKWSGSRTDVTGVLELDDLDNSLAVSQFDGTLQKIILNKNGTFRSIAHYHHPKGSSIHSISNTKDLLLSNTTQGLISIFSLKSPWTRPETIQLPPRTRAWSSLLTPSNVFLGTPSSISIHSLTPTGPIFHRNLHGPSPPARSSAYSLGISPHSPNTSLSSWYDSHLRLHDLRSSSSSPTINFYDPWADSPMYTSTFLGEHFVVGGSARHGMLALFDIRYPKYGYSVFSPHGKGSPVYALKGEGGRLWGVTEKRAFVVTFDGSGEDGILADQLVSSTNKGRREVVQGWRGRKMKWGSEEDRGRVVGYEHREKTVKLFESLTPGHGD